MRGGREIVARLIQELFMNRAGNCLIAILVLASSLQTLAAAVVTRGPYLQVGTASSVGCGGAPTSRPTAACATARRPAL